MNELSSLPLLTFLIFSPLLGVMILMFVPAGRMRAIQLISITTTFIPLLLALIIYGNYDRWEQGKQVVEQQIWVSIPFHLQIFESINSWTFNIQYYVSIDGISLPLIIMTTIIACMAAFASLYIKKRWKSYFILFLLLEVGMLGAFLARDLLLFFIFFEWTLVPTYLLIGIWGYMHREKAANQFLLYNGFGSALLLIAFMLLIVTAGFTVHYGAGNIHLSYSGNIDHILHNLQTVHSYVNQQTTPFYLSAGMRTFIFLLLFISFGIKIPFFPFHTWLLRVHKEAPASVVMLHAGVLLKMGAYGFMQFGVILLPSQTASWIEVIAILGVVNVLYGAILAFMQKELTLMLGYSTVSHMGFMMLGIAAMNDLGFQGAVVQMISHGFISALFFFIMGGLLERTGTTRMDTLCGLAKRMPFFCGILLLTGLASLGLPGLSGFVAELLSLLGLFKTMKGVAILAAGGIILSAVYILRSILAISYGARADCYAQLKDARFIEAVPLIVLTACIVLIGLFPASITVPIENGVNHMLELCKGRG